MNWTTSSRSRSDTPPIAFGFPPRTRNALPRLRANGTGLPASPSACSRPTMSLGPITTLGRTHSVKVAQAQLAGLQQRQVNARGCGRVEDVVEPRAPPHECLDALGERHEVVPVGEHRELRAGGIERILAEESEFGYPAIQGARPRSGLDRVSAPNDTSGAIARTCGNRGPIGAVRSCIRIEPRKEPLQRIDRKPQRDGAFRRCRREQSCADNVAEHAPGSALGQPRNARCLAAIDPAADQGFVQQAAQANTARRAVPRCRWSMPTGRDCTACAWAGCRNRTRRR